MRKLFLSVLREVELLSLTARDGSRNVGGDCVDERERWLRQRRPDPELLYARYRTYTRWKLPRLDEREVELLAAVRANHYADRCVARERRLRAMMAEDPQRFERLVERYNSRAYRQWEDVVWWGA